uniref:Uncharacterized protein n=1 Tax=Photinus pyralis TaxID=7054 RepID=A0A1Y1LNB3_PHOPY
MTKKSIFGHMVDYLNEKVRYLEQGDKNTRRKLEENGKTMRKETRRTQEQHEQKRPRRQVKSTVGNEKQAMTKQGYTKTVRRRTHNVMDLEGISRRAEKVNSKKQEQTD